MPDPEREDSRALQAREDVKDMSRTARASDDSPAATSDDNLAEQATVRDRVWDATLSLISSRPLPFQAWRVRRRACLDDSHDRTIRRVLSSMEAAGWLEHDDGSPWWYPGEKAAERFDVDYPHRQHREE